MPGFGVPMFVGVAVVAPLFFLLLGERPTGSWIIRLVAALPLWLCAGYFHGRLMWWIRERDYQADQSKRAAADDLSSSAHHA